MSRPSQSLPMHRRPSWAKKPTDYQIYIMKQNSRYRATPDYGQDNFSYDIAYIDQWQAPPELLKHLVPELRNAAETFTLAGAAVCTALERIGKLDAQAVCRMNPEVSHGHLINRCASDQTQAEVGAETPPMSPPTLSMTSTAAPSRYGNHNLTKQTFPQLPVNVVGLESPPYTPVDSKVPNTPVSGLLVGPSGRAPDLDSVTAQLSPLSSGSALTRLPSPEFMVQNKIAWEHFVKEFEEALRDIRRNALSSLKGEVDKIGIILTELRLERSLSMEQEVALKDFERWWRTMKPKVRDCEGEVEGLRKHHLSTQERF